MRIAANYFERKGSLCLEGRIVRHLNVGKMMITFVFSLRVYIAIMLRKTKKLI